MKSKLLRRFFTMTFQGKSTIYSLMHQAELIRDLPIVNKQHKVRGDTMRLIRLCE